MLGIGPEIFQVADDFPSTPLSAGKRKAKQKRLEKGKPKILVVDDEHTIANTLAEILKRSGFRATAAYDGQTALQLAAKLQPDYLLTDVLMPMMNGIELAIAITNLLPATKIVLFSGHAGISDILHQSKQDGYHFELIAKPIHPEKLIEYLKNA